MAIQKSIADDFGVTHSSAYARIESVWLQSNNVVELFIKVFHDAAARSKSDTSATKTPFINSMVAVSLADGATYFADGVLDDNNKSPLKQAYTYVKAQSSLLGQNWTTGTTDV